MVEPYAEAPTLERAIEIKNEIKVGFFFGIDYIGEDGIPHLVKDNGRFLN